MPELEVAKELASRSSAPQVRFEDATKPFVANDVLGFSIGRRIESVAVKRQVVQALVRPIGVVELHVFRHEEPKMILAEDDEAIEALDLERLQPAFHERVHVW